MRNVLSKINGIGEMYLVDSYAIARPSLAERMSWPSRRETTREEDLAYCLFSIFDVQIPLLFGEEEEGKQRFHRRDRATQRVENANVGLFVRARLHVSRHPRHVTKVSPVSAQIPFGASPHGATFNRRPVMVVSRVQRNCCRGDQGTLRGQLVRQHQSGSLLSR